MQAFYDKVNIYGVNCNPPSFKLPNLEDLLFFFFLNLNYEKKWMSGTISRMKLLDSNLVQELR